MNLYTYVANSPLKYTDRMGREREKVLILVGQEKDPTNINYYFGDLTIRSTTLALTYEIQKKKYLAMGYKESNIIRRNVSNIDDVNKYMKEGSYKNIAIVAHSNERSVQLTYGGVGNQRIDSTTVSQLVSLEGTNTTTLTIDGCMSGYGEHPIAMDIRNRVGITVKAPNSMIESQENASDYLNGGREPELSIDGIASPIGAFFSRNPATFITF